MLSFLSSMLVDVLPRPTPVVEDTGIHYRDILGVQREMIKGLQSKGYVVTDVRVHKRNWYALVTGQGWMNVNSLLKNELRSPVELLNVMY